MKQLFAQIRENVRRMYYRVMHRFIAYRVMRDMRIAQACASDAMRETVYHYAENNRLESMAQYLRTPYMRFLYRLQYVLFWYQVNKPMYRTMARVEMRRIAKRLNRFVRRTLVWIIIIAICL